MNNAENSFILKETINKIGIITINNPTKRNALNSKLLGEIVATLKQFESAKTTIIIIRAQKDAKVWSAGLDVSEFPKAQGDPFGYENSLETTLRAIEQYPGPVIAMVQGSVWGGACDLVITCDMIIGDPTCSFAITPAKIGVPYTASGIMHFINRVGLNIAKEMFFSALPIDAFRAERHGILNHLVLSENIEEFTLDLANKISSQSSLSIAVIKEQFRILSQAYPISPYAFERIHSIRRKVYDSKDYEEGIKAFLEKREPKFIGE